MAKIRKMIGKVDSPAIISLMGLIETQSKNTIVKWCNGYARENILPIYEKDYPEDMRLKMALDAVDEWLSGSMKLVDVKKIIREAQVAAREAEKNPSAQAAAIAYSTVGVNEATCVYDEIAVRECEKMYEALDKIAIKDEVNPAKINWNC